jgi:1,4-alpha-glucan branching enzyme
MQRQVWAPNADRVSLLTFDRNVRDVNSEPGRTPDEPSETPMTQSDVGVWTVEFDQSPGDEYLFRVVREGESFDRLDPRGRSATSSIGRSVVVDDTFPWTDSDFVAPPLSNWVIYELHPATFAGTLDDVVCKLDQLTDLGITVIELMPVAEFAGDQSWGYNPALPFAVESSLGGPDALRRLVDAAHARGIAVLLDVVYNHFGPSDLDLWRFDGWSENDGGGIYFYNDWRAKTPWGETRPDYGRDEVRQFIIDNAVMWIEDYHLDGLRLDSTVNIRNAHGEPGPNGDLDEGASLLADLTDTMRAKHPGAILIAEDLQEDARLTAATSSMGLGFHLQWSGQFVHTIRRSLEALDDAERDIDAVIAAVEGTIEGAERVVYTESHDEVANGRTRVPAEIDPENPQSIWAFRRSALGAVLVMTAVGVPMMFQGQEWGEEDWFDDARDLRWERRDARSGTVALWRDLVRLRTGADDRARGLSGDRISVHRLDEVPEVIVFWRWGMGGEHAAAIVVVNLSAQDHEIEVPVPEGGEWRSVFASDWSGYDVSGTDLAPVVPDGSKDDDASSVRFTIASYGAVVLARPPDEGGTP